MADLRILQSTKQSVWVFVSFSHRRLLKLRSHDCPIPFLEYKFTTPVKFQVQWFKFTISQNQKYSKRIMTTRCRSTPKLRIQKFQDSRLELRIDRAYKFVVNRHKKVFVNFLNTKADKKFWISDLRAPSRLKLVYGTLHATQNELIFYC